MKSYIFDGDTNKGVGVLVIRDGKILVGTRSDTGELAGPGGHIQDNETPMEAAIRETQEEFGITPIQLTHFRDNPLQYLCSDYTGEIICSDGEMSNPIWLSPEELIGKKLFKPFADSLHYITTLKFDKKDAHGNEHSEENGQFVSKGNNVASNAIETKTKPSGAFIGDSAKVHLAKRQDEGEYLDLDVKQYQALALNLLNTEISKDVLGYETTNGKKVRWNTTTNDYVTSKDGTNPTTLFKLRGGQKRFDKLHKRDIEEALDNEENS
jgi:8-oxo-dGTP pyrophosphatase MutT (NUDIX family)